MSEEHTSDSYSVRETLARLDERTRSIKNDIQFLKEEITSIKRSVKEETNDINESLAKYVTKEEFSPIQRAIYTVASLIVMSVIGTLISLVLKR